MNESRILVDWRPLLILIVAVCLIAPSLNAQSPIGSEILVSPENFSQHVLPDLQFDERGGLWIAWLEFFDNFEANHVLARAVSPQGELGPVMVPVEPSNERERPYIRNQMVVPLQDERLLLIYSVPKSGAEQVFGQRFESSAQLLGEPIPLTPPTIGRGRRGKAVVPLPQGGFALLVDEYRCCFRDSIHVQILDPEGFPVNRYFPVPRRTRGLPVPQSSGVRSLTADGLGNITVVWTVDHGGARDDSDVHGRRFSSTGEPIGTDFIINSTLRGTQYDPSVAAAPDGSFVVVWQSVLPGAEVGSIFGQRFSKAGKKVGPEFRISEERTKWDLTPDVSMDRYGNFVAVWQNSIYFRPPCVPVRARVFRKDGSPIGPEFPVASERSACSQDPKAMFSPSGTFAIAWDAVSGFDSNLDSIIDVYAARFSASPGDEPCIVRGGRVSCDTGRTGGPAELAIDFGGRPSETTLAGDLDGDGRADVCSYLEGTFRCDLDHRGEPAESAALSFGQAGDVPLLGDVDGNGKADPCLRRGDQLLCDTAHDGGTAEVSLRFDTAENVPLLGDVNGDGRDDLCLWRPGELRCDTAHDGGAPEVTIAFGQAGDLPALGDLDGDGRDDLCVLRDSNLLCDTAHDGGAPELDLALGFTGQPGDRPLIANLDGL